MSLKQFAPGVLVGIAIAVVVMVFADTRSPQLPIGPAGHSEARVEMILAYQEAFLDTVYWSLGGVLTLALALVGFSWFSSSAMHERDKEALRQELTTQIEQFKRALAAKQARTREALRTTAVRAQHELAKQVNAAVDVRVRAAEEQVALLRYRVAREQATNPNTSPRDAIAYYIECLRVAADHHRALAYDDANVIEALQRLIESHGPINVDPMIRITEATRKIAEVHPHLRDRLAALESSAVHNSLEF